MVTKKQRAIFWIASTHKYCEEATESAKTVMRHMPEVERVLAAPVSNITKYDLFDRHLTLPKRLHKFWFLDSARYYGIVFNMLTQAGFRQLLALDTDTYMVLPVYDIFKLLDSFDFVGAHAPGRNTTKTYHNIPAAFPEINVGVLGICCNGRVDQLMMDWYDGYKREQSLYGNNDQGALRDALWVNTGTIRPYNVSMYVLPTEYNLRTIHDQFISRQVKILHGRMDGIEAVADRINVTDSGRLGMRIWQRKK